MDNRRNNYNNYRANYNANYRRRPKKRITGRFYAFVTMVVVLAVMVGVLVSTRQNNKPVSAIAPTYNTPVQQTVAMPPQTQTNTQQTQEVTQQSGGDTIAPAPQTEIEQTQTQQPTIETDGMTGGDLFGGGTEADDDSALQVDESEAGSVQVNELSITQGLNPDWRNVLLLGTDTRNIKKAHTSRTDTIIIASINGKTGQVKLCSILRDMVVPHPKKPGSEVKITSVNVLGGPELVMKTINELFGMNIKEYALVNFGSFQKVVDILGGIRIDLSEAEKDQVNLGLGEVVKAGGEMSQEEYLAKRDSLQLQVYGADTLLTGMQALCYARIRHIDSDYVRSERQRTVLDAILKKVRADSNALDLMQIATTMLGQIDTNIGVWDAMAVATPVLKAGSKGLDMAGRIPAKDTFKAGNRSGIGYSQYDIDYAANAQKLFDYIYG